MSDTVSAQLTLSVTSSLYSVDKYLSFTDALSMQGANAGIQDVSTTVEALSVGDVASTNQGLLMLHNLDPSNYATYGSSNLEWKIDPDEFQFARVNPGSIIYVKANSSPIRLELLLLAK